VELRDRVIVSTDRSFAATRARVRVRCGGRSFEAETDTGIPARDLAAQRSRLRAKFDAIARPVLGRERADALAARALALDSLPDAGELVRLAQPASD
jgi:hypothetical protein